MADTDRPFRQRLNHQANENQAKNLAAYKQWLAQYSPAEIKAANVARHRLASAAKKSGQKKSYPPLKDERIVKQARGSYAYFLSDRFASGDMKNMTFTEIGPLIAREWKALTAAGKKVASYPNQIHPPLSPKLSLIEMLTPRSLVAVR
jgi:hypothetical protein